MSQNYTSKKNAHVVCSILACLLVYAGCGKKESPPEKNWNIPRRIVSLSPSITKMIIELKGEKSLVGVTSYHPPLKKPVPVIGTLVNPVVEKIIQMKPDAVFLSREDGATQKTDLLRATGLRVIELERHRNFNDIKNNYLLLGAILGQERLASRNMADYEKKLADTFISDGNKKSVIFLISTRPVVTISRGSFIHAIISDAGGANVFENLASAYPVITFEAIVQANPEVIIVMTRGGKEEISARLKTFPLRVNKKRNIFEILPDSVAYYTPSDYLKAVEEIRGIFSAAEQGLPVKK